jgi:hypothetical protein
MAIAATQGANIGNFRAVYITSDPTCRVSTRTVMAGEATDAAGATLEIDAVTGSAIARTLAPHPGTVL